MERNFYLVTYIKENQIEASFAFDHRAEAEMVFILEARQLGKEMKWEDLKDGKPISIKDKTNDRTLNLSYPRNPKDDILVGEKIPLKNTKVVELIMRGSGNPKEPHQVVAINFLDKEGNAARTVGDVPKGTVRVSNSKPV